MSCCEWEFLEIENTGCTSAFLGNPASGESTKADRFEIGPFLSLGHKYQNSSRDYLLNHIYLSL